MKTSERKFKPFLFIFLLLTACTFKTFSQQNYVAIDPVLPLFGTLQVQYEKAIFHRFSGVLGIGYKSSSGLFEINGVKTESINLDDIDFGGFKILPEVRWYFGRNEKGMTGIYTGIYYKYQSNKSKVTGIYTTSDGTNTTVDLDMSFSSNTGGIEIGYKVRAYKGLCFDFIFAGLGLTSHRVIISENTVLPEKFYQRFSDAAEQYSILKELEPKINFTREDLDTRILMPNFRYGVKIGWAF